jgi:AcrR family transcriptional regulator
VSTAKLQPTRDLILDAAARLFAARGGEVKLEDVAGEAGVSRQAVYLHFGSRTGLLVAMAQHMDSTGALPDLLSRVFDASTATEALDAAAALHAEYHPMVYQVARVFMVGRYEDQALRAAWDERMESRRNLYQNVVERLQAEGHLAPTWDIETATDFLLALTSWQFWEQLVIDRGWSTKDYLDHIRTVIRQTLVIDSPA